MPVPADSLARLFPLESLRQETREQLAREAMVSDYQRGENVFESGDLDDDTVYLSKANCAARTPTVASSRISPAHRTGAIRSTTRCRAASPPRSFRAAPR